MHVSTVEQPQQDTAKLTRLLFATARSQRLAQAEAGATRLLLAELLPLVRPTDAYELAIYQDAQARLARESLGSAFLEQVEALKAALRAMLFPAGDTEAEVRAQALAALKAMEREPV